MDRDQRTTIIVAILFIVIVGAMFGFAYLKKTELRREPEPTTRDEPTVDRLAYITRIDAKHFYIDGTHTIAGEIVMPTPCDLLESGATVAESYPEQVRLDFTVINNDIDLCAQVLTPQRFKIEFDASEEATVRAFLDGREVILNLISATDDESPDDFELFIKG